MPSSGSAPAGGRRCLPQQLHQAVGPLQLPVDQQRLSAAVAGVVEQRQQAFVKRRAPQQVADGGLNRESETQAHAQWFSGEEGVQVFTSGADTIVDATEVRLPAPGYEGEGKPRKGKQVSEFQALPAGQRCVLPPPLASRPAGCMYVRLQGLAGHLSSVAETPFQGASSKPGHWSKLRSDFKTPDHLLT